MRRMTSPERPRRTPAGLTRTRERSIRRTLASPELIGATAYVVGHRPARALVADGLSGHPVQRDVTAPRVVGDVVVLVVGPAGADLERGLPQRHREHLGRGQLLAPGSPDGGRPA